MPPLQGGDVGSNPAGVIMDSFTTKPEVICLLHRYHNGQVTGSQLLGALVDLAKRFGFNNATVLRVFASYAYASDLDSLVLSYRYVTDQGVSW